MALKADRIALLLIGLFMATLLNAQNSDIKKPIITYEIFGLGSNLGDSTRAITVEGNMMEYALPRAVTISEATQEDTLGKRYYSYDSTLYIYSKDTVVLRQSSLDSIRTIIQHPIGRVGGGNWCVRSGSVHYLEVAFDSTDYLFISMHNTFDSTALAITNILLPYFHEKTMEFRPLKMWEHAIKCREGMIKMRKQFDAMTEEEKRTFIASKKAEKEEKPVDRRATLNANMREELNNDPDD